MTRIISFFEKPVIGLTASVSAYFVSVFGSIIDTTQPLIGWVTMCLGAITAACMAALWVRKVYKAFISDVTHKKMRVETTPPF